MYRRTSYLHYLSCSDDSTAQNTSPGGGSTACPQVVDDQTLDMARVKDEIAELNKYRTNSDTRFLRQETTIHNIDAALSNLGKSVNRLTATVEDFERRSENLKPKNGNRLAILVVS